jgi:hypothetical protein
MREPCGTQEDWVKHRWEKDTRYYEAHLHQDLWGGWVLTHVWGRRGTALGRIWHLPCVSYEEGLGRLTEIDRRRQQRGYHRTKESGWLQESVWSRNRVS